MRRECAGTPPGQDLRPADQDLSHQLGDLSLLRVAHGLAVHHLTVAFLIFISVRIPQFDTVAAGLLDNNPASDWMERPGDRSRRSLSIARFSVVGTP